MGDIIRSVRRRDSGNICKINIASLVAGCLGP